MDRAFKSGASATPPSAPASPSVGYPTEGNPASSVAATKPGEYWYHMMTEEVRKVIVDAGLTPNHLDLTQLSSAVQILASAASIAIGAVVFVAKRTAPSGYLKANGAAVSRTAYANLFAALVKSSTATISIATPGVVTWNNHGLAANDPVKFSTTGALPTGLSTGTTYYVVGASVTTNTFQLSATVGGAAINTSGSQSGTHTAINAPFGDGDGSTTFNLPDLRGEFLRGWDDSRGVDASRVFGSAQAQDIQPHTHTYGFVSQTQAGSGGTYWAGAVSSNTGSTGGTETRPRNVALLACIKY